MSTELSQPQGFDLSAILNNSEALSKTPVETIERLTALYNQQMDRQAEVDLGEALAKFQAESPLIIKARDGHNCKYASLDDIMRQIQPHLAAHGLSISFDTETAENSVTAVCHVRKGTKSIARRVTVPVDTRMSANSTQQMGSAISYSKRYSIAAALNLILSDEDDDGQAVVTETLSDEQADTVHELIASVEELEPDVRHNMLVYFGVAAVADIPASRFKEAQTILQKKLKKAQN